MTSAVDTRGGIADSDDDSFNYDQTLADLANVNESDANGQEEMEERSVDSTRK